jgi:hypothetical protein
MTNLLSYCGLVDARRSASEKDLPVMKTQFDQNWGCKIVRLSKLRVLGTRSPTANKGPVT